jgi:hypothetical protein
MRGRGWWEGRLLRAEGRIGERERVQEVVERLTLLEFLLLPVPPTWALLASLTALGWVQQDEGLQHPVLL